VYNLMLSGQLDGEFRGGRWFVTERSIDDLLKRRAADENTAPNAPPRS
jgi:hypothetical protein